MFAAGATSDSTDQFLISLEDSLEAGVYSLIALLAVVFLESSKACRIGVIIPVHPLPFPPLLILPLLDELPREELYFEGRFPP